MNSFSQRVRTLLGVALLAGACGVLQAAPTSSTFEPTQVVQGTTLKLNGAGTRYKVVFRLYDLALYTQSKVSTPEELLALPDLPGTDLGLVFIKGLSANSSPELVRKHTVSSNRLVEIFSGRSKLTAGDTFAMEYVPGKGTTFYIQGQAQGAPLGDAEYFGMVLKIWVGSSPADFKLKDALLGR